MKIGILSDTHKKEQLASEAIEHLSKMGVEFFIHAGDIVKESTLKELQSSGRKYVAVYGNNDAHLVEVHNRYNLVQEPYSFKLADTTFKLMHLPFYMSADAEVIIYGHTHQFGVEFKGNSLYLNSGEVCARSKPVSECAMLEVLDDRFIVSQYSRPLKDREFNLETHTFIRGVK